MITLEQFAFDLPEELIAQTPTEPRDHCRLLVLNRDTGEVHHKHFYDLLELLGPSDVLVRNNTKVLPARIFGKKLSGGHCEILLVKQVAHTQTCVEWECLTKPGLKVGQEIVFENTSLRATCTSMREYTRIIRFHLNYKDFFIEIDKIGHTPLPPYIDWHKHDESELRQLYQTTFAKKMGSVAAPTAGLHFTPKLDQQLGNLGVQIEEVTLHVGLGTFLPVQATQLETQTLHQEVYEVTAAAASRINQAKEAGKRIIAVGTTTTRVLETCSRSGELIAHSGETDIFIQPGFKFRCVDGLITNFHLSTSSLLMLVSALVSQPNTQQPFQDFSNSSIGAAYQAAIKEKYRFYSFGDAMLIL